MTALVISMIVGFVAAALFHRGSRSRLVVDATQQQYDRVYGRLVRHPIARDRYLLRLRIAFEGSAILFGLIGLACAGILIERLIT